MSQNSTIERRSYILNLLEMEGQVDVNTLSVKFKVSEVTIRKDLNYFEKKNMLIRSRGGAFKQNVIGHDLSIYKRRKKNMDKKKVIGAAAAGTIDNGETILLDSGTTIMELVNHITKQNEITVITNAIDIAYRLAEFPKCKVIVPGGILRQNSLSLVGEQAATTLRDFFCDKCFIGADGIDIERGLLTSNIEEAHLMRINIRNAKKVIALVDSSKFNSEGIMTVAKLSEIDAIITDQGISDDIRKELREKKIELIVVD
jgi:DeoR family transcriptional regulator, aga operon transcriptional repressor